MAAGLPGRMVVAAPPTKPAMVWEGKQQVALCSNPASAMRARHYLQLPGPQGLPEKWGGCGRTGPATGMSVQRGGLTHGSVPELRVKTAQGLPFPH